LHRFPGPGQTNKLGKKITDKPRGFSGGGGFSSNLDFSPQNRNQSNIFQ
jgi:hypothetical protein